MCGLVGDAGKLVFKDELFMKRLLMIDYFRGPDSTGLAAIRSNGDVHIAKGAVSPPELFDSKRFNIALNGNASRAFIGHNRSATKGKVTALNSHPFHHGHIVGAHNGTLEFESIRYLEKLLGQEYETDSEALFAAIAQEGVENVIPELIEGKDSIKGAWALTWYNQEEDTLNFLRNKHRPLWYAWTKDCDRIVWASEWPMIDHVVQMSTGFEFWKDKKTNHCGWQFKEDILFSIKLADLVANKDKPLKFKAKELKGKEPPKGFTYTGNYSAGSNYDPLDPWEKKVVHKDDENICGFHLRGPTSKKNLTTTSPRGSDKKRVIHLIGDVSSPYAGVLTKEMFDELAKDGCWYCQTPVEFTDPGVTIWEKDNIVLCTQCSGYHGYKESDPPSNRIYMNNKRFEELL